MGASGVTAGTLPAVPETVGTGGELDATAGTSPAGPETVGAGGERGATAGTSSTGPETVGAGGKLGAVVGRVDVTSGAKGSIVKLVITCKFEGRDNTEASMITVEDWRSTNRVTRAPNSMD